MLRIFSSTSRQLCKWCSCKYTTVSKKSGNIWEIVYLSYFFSDKQGARIHFFHSSLGVNVRVFFNLSFENNIADVPVLWDWPYAHEQAGFVLMNCELPRKTGSLLLGWIGGGRNAHSEGEITRMWTLWMCTRVKRIPGKLFSSSATQLHSWLCQAIV